MNRPVGKKFRRLRNLLIAAFLTGVCAWLWVFIHKGPAKKSDLPAIQAGLYLNSALDVSFVGTAACISCHPDEHRSFMKTDHSRSLMEVDLETAPSSGRVTHDLSGRIYEIYERDGELHHSEILRTDDGREIVLADFAMTYVIGSGHHAQSYLAESGGFLIQSPVTWYKSTKRWSMSPGYETRNAGFARPVYDECLFCHSGSFETVGKSPGRLKIHEAAIGCERCHGPGQFHVKLRNDGGGPDGGTDLTIVNPGKLTRTLSEAICAQCHLHGIAGANVRGRSLKDYRPGLLRRDFRIDFSLERANDSMTVVGHVEQMRMSRCYRESDTLTCITCHNPHFHGDPEQRYADYRKKCLSCHSEHACGLRLSERLRLKKVDDCVGCHMPRSPTEVAHVASTHHRISVFREEPVQDSKLKRAPGRLVPIDDMSHLPLLERDRCLGLAYLDLSLKEADPEHSETYRKKALEILSRFHETGLRDPEVETALAQIHQRHAPKLAVQFAQSALGLDDVPGRARLNALSAMSNAHLYQGESILAIEPLENLVRLRRQAGDWYLLAVCRYRAGDADEALKAAQYAVRIRPDNQTFRKFLSELYQQAGNPRKAAEHREMAEKLVR